MGHRDRVTGSSPGAAVAEPPSKSTMAPALITQPANTPTM